MNPNDSVWLKGTITTSNDSFRLKLTYTNWIEFIYRMRLTELIHTNSNEWLNLTITTSDDLNWLKLIEFTQTDSYWLN